MKPTKEAIHKAILETVGTSTMLRMRIIQLASKRHDMEEATLNSLDVGIKDLIKSGALTMAGSGARYRYFITPNSGSNPGSTARHHGHKRTP